MRSDICNDVGFAPVFNPYGVNHDCSRRHSSIFFHCFSQKIRLDVSSESSARQRIHMKIQALFSSKDKSKKLKCCLLQFLFGALRVNNMLLQTSDVIESDSTMMLVSTLELLTVSEDVLYNFKQMVEALMRLLFGADCCGSNTICSVISIQLFWVNIFVIIFPCNVFAQSIYCLDFCMNFLI